MPSVRILNELKDQTYFITITVKNWHYLFDQLGHFSILEDSFVYCQNNKKLTVYAFIFMLNHIHFIGPSEDMGSLLRDMKGHISRQLKKNLQKNRPNLLQHFKTAKGYEFWEKTNYPKLITSIEFFEQKLNYIHMNPVKKGYVHLPEEWRWSSASKIPTKIRISELEW